MVFTLRLNPIRGYDYGKTRDVLARAKLCSHDLDQQTQSASVIMDGGTVQFRRESVSIVVRAEDPRSILRVVYLAAWAGTGDSPSFETVSYDLAGTPSMATIGAIFTALVDGLREGGDVSEAVTLWRQEVERIVRAELAVRDLEEKIREAGPGGAPLEAFAR